MRCDLRLPLDHAHYYLLDLGSSAGVPEPQITRGNGVADASPGAAFVHAGPHTGDIGLAIELCDSASPLDTAARD